MSIENPRQEAGEPSVPDFRWLHDHGLFRVDPDGKIYQIVDHDGEPFETAIEWTSLPADAVNLGDVEALRAGCKKTMDEAVRSWNKLAAERDEAKRQLDIAESVAANTKAHYIRRCENLASVRDRIRGERDEDRAKLAKVRELLVNHAAHAQPHAALLAIDEATR